MSSATAAVEFSPREALQRTIEHREIFADEMTALMRAIMRGEVSPVMTAAILTGLRVKKETVGEITAAAQVLREFAVPVPADDADADTGAGAGDQAAAAPFHAPLLDIVGTGGDGAHTFNISTTAMFVAAACGVRVAKHGNRGVSSKSGAADVLEALGASIELQPAQVAQCLRECGIGFMYAPLHHPAMRQVGPVRRELGVRTLFNILGPLVNPAGASHTLLGVFHPDLVGILARVLQRLGTRRALVVHGEDGVDELSLGAPSLIAELDGGQIREYRLQPAELGLAPQPLSALRVDSPEASRATLLAVLDGTPGPAHDVVCLNAGAALYAAGVVDSIASGLARARAAIASGAARTRLTDYVAATRRLAAAGA